MKEVVKSPVNKKIKNATPTSVEGITFRSKLESKVYNILKENGFFPRYEEQTVTLLEGFYPNNNYFIDGEIKTRKLLAITYTPDFIFEHKGYTIYLEVKGWANDTYAIKRKLFCNYVNSMEKSIFFEVKTIKGLKKTIEIIQSL